MSTLIGKYPGPDYVHCEFGTWDELYHFYRTNFVSTGATANGSTESLWVFRGQHNSSWKLQTKLERELESASVPAEKYGYFEEGLVREFQRRLQAAEELTSIPEPDNIIGWLALMQHHGAPTRLLDWSYSFFVALFFAAEVGSTDAAVYAINASWCNDQARKRLPDPEEAKRSISFDPYITTSSTFRSLFVREPEIPLVYRINTFSLNTRLAIQQGLFMCPGAITRSFEENLRALCPPSNSPCEPVMYKLIIKTSTKKLRSDILTELSYMNIGRHSLFPGIDGFAQSIAQFLRHSDRLFPPWRKKQGGRPFELWLNWHGWLS